MRHDEHTTKNEMVTFRTRKPTVAKTVTIFRTSAFDFPHAFQLPYMGMKNCAAQNTEFQSELLIQTGCCQKPPVAGIKQNSSQGVGFLGGGLGGSVGSGLSIAGTLV